MSLGTILFVEQEETRQKERLGAPIALVVRPLTGDGKGLKGFCGGIFGASSYEKSGSAAKNN